MDEKKLYLDLRAYNAYIFLVWKIILINKNKTCSHKLVLLYFESSLNHCGKVITFNIIMAFTIFFNCK